MRGCRVASEPTSPAVEPLALRPSDAAKALGISLRTLQFLLAAEVIPSIKLGRMRLVPVYGLKRWLEATQRGGAL